MADFKTHISASTAIGAAYGAAGYVYGFPPSSCVVAGGLCSLAGMLPDLDSGSGRPFRELMSLTAAVIPALMIPRFQQLGLDAEQLVISVAALYLAIRFGFAWVFLRSTVHRGMWHSIPAAAIAGMLAFLIISGQPFEIRVFKSAAVVLGFVVHLLLDEFWSFEVRRGRLRIKPSLGTALKFWSDRSAWASVSTYGKLAALVALAVGDPYLMQQIGAPPSEELAGEETVGGTAAGETGAATGYSFDQPAAEDRLRQPSGSPLPGDPWGARQPARGPSSEVPNAESASRWLYRR